MTRELARFRVDCRACGWSAEFLLDRGGGEAPLRAAERATWETLAERGCGHEPRAVQVPGTVVHVEPDPAVTSGAAAAPPPGDSGPHTAPPAGPATGDA